MATVDRNTLKQWFVTGAKPTALQFWELIDSFLHKNDKVQANKIEGLQEALDSKASAETALISIAHDSTMHGDGTEVSPLQVNIEELSLNYYTKEQTDERINNARAIWE
jgi:hypothetical protein